MLLSIHFLEVICIGFFTSSVNSSTPPPTLMLTWPCTSTKAVVPELSTGLNCLNQHPCPSPLPNHHAKEVQFQQLIDMHLLLVRYCASILTQILFHQICIAYAHSLSPDAH
jgi:hypothetical protein